MERISFKEKLGRALRENLDIELSEQQFEQMFILAEHLAEVNKVMNLTAITDEDGIILRHIVDSLMISPYISEGGSLIDIGCGAGFPTLPLAIARSDIKICAVDSTEKRVRYVKETAELLGLNNVNAIAARAEELALLPEHRETYDHATARAVAALPVLCELTLPFVRLGGTLVAMKAKGAHEELDASRNAIRKLCGATADHGTSVFETSLKGNVDGEDICENRTIIVAKKSVNTPKGYPRKFSQIKKSPL